VRKGGRTAHVKEENKSPPTAYNTRGLSWSSDIIRRARKGKGGNSCLISKGGPSEGGRKRVERKCLSRSQSQKQNHKGTQKKTEPESACFQIWKLRTWIEAEFLSTPLWRKSGNTCDQKKGAGGGGKKKSTMKLTLLLQRGLKCRARQGRRE